MKKILVAEDEQNIREFVVINLERAGYRAYEAENGDQALELYEQENGDFDVAVLDIMMPGDHDGLAVCKELRRRNPSIGIILLSARTQSRPCTALATFPPGMCSPPRRAETPMPGTA